MAQQTTGRSPYVLELDPDPQLVPIARMFAATLARQYGCSEDSVLDVKIAISEACTTALMNEGDPPEAPIKIIVQEDVSGLWYEVDANTPAPDLSQARPDANAQTVNPALGLALIRGLFPDAEIKGTDDRSIVRFRLDRS